VVAELVIVDRRGEVLPWSMGARPGVRIECGVAQIFVSRPMELLAAASGHDADLSARRAAELGRVVGGEDLNFLRGIHIGGAEAGAVGASPDRGRAVISDQALGCTRAVDVARALSEI